LPSVNSDFLKAIGELYRRGADGVLTVVAGSIQRVVHVARGQLVGADSNVRAEKLGQLLVAEGKLDPVLIEPLAAAAKAAGRLLGDQLLAEKLVAPSELVAALERQVIVRFEQALLMQGRVASAPKSAIQLLVRRPLGAAALDAFRRFPLEAIEPLIAAMPQGPSQPVEAHLVDGLALTPAELKVWRRLATGHNVPEVLAESQPPELGARLIAVLVGLEILR